MQYLICYTWYSIFGRFYQGRRSTDDDRQVARGNGVIGSSGRWRNNLANKVLGSGLPLPVALEKESISPKIRQLLQVIDQIWSYGTYKKMKKLWSKKKYKSCQGMMYEL